MVLPTLPPQCYMVWKVSLSLLHALAIISTIYRLVHRFRIHRTWWDDYVIFLPLILDIVYAPLMWFRFNHRVDPSNAPLTYQILSSNWLTFFPFLVILWFTRMVLALSLARIFPPRHPARLWSLTLVAFMALSCITSNLVHILSCKQTSWLMIGYEATNCITNIGGIPVRTIFLFVDDALSDLLLIISPLVLFWRVKLPQKERRLILMVFCGSILTLLSATAFIVISMNTVISMGEDYLLIIAGLAYIETAISLFVCNLAIISTCLYQTCVRRRNPECPASQNAEETSQNPSRQCTCFSTRTPLTLTEISSLSSQSGQTSQPSRGTSPVHTVSFSLHEKSDFLARSIPDDS